MQLFPVFAERYLSWLIVVMIATNSQLAKPAVQGSRCAFCEPDPSVFTGE